MVDIVVMNGRGKIKEGSALTSGSRQSTLARWQSTNPLFLKYLLKGLPHCEDIKKNCILAFLFLPPKDTKLDIFHAKTSKRSNHSQLVLHVSGVNVETQVG